MQVSTKSGRVSIRGWIWERLDGQPLFSYAAETGYVAVARD
jgi:hypothetical protein